MSSPPACAPGATGCNRTTTVAARRAPGLRREEVAQRAGLSIDYLARLEQGRADNPSPSVLAPLARALELSDAERDHLYRVAGAAPPTPGQIDRRITPAVRRVLDGLNDAPVLVTDAAWTVIAANPLARELLGTAEGNVAARHFAGEPSRVVRTDEEVARFERELVGDLHDALGRYPDDEPLQELIAGPAREQPALRRAVGAAAGRAAHRRPQDDRAPAARADDARLRRHHGSRQRAADDRLHRATGQRGRGSACRARHDIVPRVTMRCKGWQQEAALLMLENNLHPDVAEKPEELVVYGGIGKAARNHAALAAIKHELMRLESTETLLVQSGKPVGVFETHEAAPRVLIANSNLVPNWANWDEFRRLDAEGLMMYGQMTAGSWIYIGTQGILQGTYETFAAIARKRFGGTLKGRLVVTAGLGGMGGAQPLAVTMNEGCALCIEVDSTRIERRIRERYLDERAGSLDDALERLAAAQREGRALSIGLLGNAAEILPELARRDVEIDVVTDQTSAHDPLNGYIPAGPHARAGGRAARSPTPTSTCARSASACVAHVGAIRDLGKKGSEAFDYGNALRGVASENGDDDAFAYPGFVPAYIRPLFCEGKGPFRWVALSGDPADIARDRRRDPRPVRRAGPHPPLDRARAGAGGVPGPAGADLLARLRRAPPRRPALQRDGRERATCQGPIVIGRDHLDAGSVASPQRETESMRDGSDAVADWPLLNAMLNVATGASWVSFHHGGGVGMGRSLHAGQVCVADGTPLAGERIRRTLLADPGMGIVRHADAGYPEALDAADRLGVRIPMR